MRAYFENRYRIMALEMTTWELLPRLKSLELDEELLLLIENFLNKSDLVKFAKYKPELVEINAAYNQACLVVEKCRDRDLALVREAQLLKQSATEEVSANENTEGPAGAETANEKTSSKHQSLVKEGVDTT